VSDLDLETVRDLIRAEFAATNAQLQVVVNQLQEIELRLDQLPNLRFLYQDEAARKVVTAMRKEDARNRPMAHIPEPIPGEPGNWHNRDRRTPAP